MALHKSTAGHPGKIAKYGAVKENTDILRKSYLCVCLCFCIYHCLCLFYLFYDFHDIFRLLPAFFVAFKVCAGFGPRFLQGGGGGKRRANALRYHRAHLWVAKEQLCPWGAISIKDNVGFFNEERDQTMSQFSIRFTQFSQQDLKH